MSLPEDTLLALRAPGITVATCQQTLQMRLHRRPLVVNDAEVHRIPDASAGQNHVMAEDALLFRPNPQEGLSGSLIQRVGLELHTDAAERPEGVAQQEILRLGVHRGALPGPGVPGPADLDAPVRPIDVSVAGTADRTCGRLADHGKGERRALGLHPKCGLDVRTQAVGRRFVRLGPLQEVFVQPDLTESRMMVERKGLQANVEPRQDNRFDHHRAGHGPSRGPPYSFSAGSISRTAFTDAANAAFSVASSGTSMIFSMPPAPSTIGTPAVTSRSPYSPSR